MRVRFLVPGNIRHISGGNVYNARLVEGLRTLGFDVEVLPVEGEWPDARSSDRRRLGSLLGAVETEARITSAEVTVVDGLIACGAPEELEAAAAAGHSAWILLHMPFPGHADGERRALKVAAGVICSSTSAADHVRERHGLAALVAPPGTDPAPVAAGSDPPHIVSVAALLPNKSQTLLVEALATLQDLAWTASLVGTVDADPAYAAQLQAAVSSHGLDSRIRLTGQLAGDALADEWNRADLSVLVSRAEAFGLVVTESLARGIPVIVRAGTGAVEALGMGSRPTPPGTAVVLAGSEGGEPEILAGTIREWLSDGALRTDWRAAALAAREHMPRWESTAGKVAAILGVSRTCRIRRDQNAVITKTQS
ncbi:glycosyltransferase family 4 protein [Pseudarthrobacter sulfonivorans]|uniref:glycosyltransferase family 4 protein n=1 Tax=Pseudarthrobacter sulfonivorans TaxID=121292 RepID=UPI0021024046|nr:glycosyltransferase family 4 protein [Pseudarthrobacter sulfonivorans]